MDSYQNAPAHQVAHAHYVIDMTNPDELRRLIAEVKPQFIVPEIEAVDTNVLDHPQADGVTVIPTARATQSTMNREESGVSPQKNGILTSRTSFASTPRIQTSRRRHGLPRVVKPARTPARAVHCPR